MGGYDLCCVGVGVGVSKVLNTGKKHSISLRLSYLPQKGKRNSKDLIGYTGHLMYCILRLEFALSKSVFLALRQENQKKKKEKEKLRWGI